MSRTRDCRSWVRYMNNEHVDGVIEQPMLSGGPGILLHHTSLAVFKDYGQHRRLAVPQDILFTRPKGGYMSSITSARLGAPGIARKFWMLAGRPCKT